MYIEIPITFAKQISPNPQKESSGTANQIQVRIMHPPIELLVKE